MPLHHGGVAEDPRIGERRYVQLVLSPVFPAPWDPKPDDVLDIEEWDGEAWRKVGKITYGDLSARRD